MLCEFNSREKYLEFLFWHNWDLVAFEDTVA